MTDLLPEGIAAAAAAIRNGTMTAAELIEVAISRADALDPNLGAYISRFDAEAREAAAQADRELAAGRDRGPLHGIPIAVKDLLSTREGPTTAQSSAQDPEALGRRDAAVIARLRANGAVITGKTTLSEHACGFPDPDQPFPVPRNPWNLEYWAGGSSAGSASVVSAGLVLGAIGTDTGGSIRIPAGFCGVTGLKTTWGAIDNDGCLPLAWSFDTVGPIARSAEDCRFILDAMSPAPVVVSDRRGLAGRRVGVDRLSVLTAATDEGQVEAFDEAVAVISEAGAEIVDLPLPHYAEVVAANYVIMLSEGLAHHLPSLRERWHDYGRSTRQLLCGGLGFTGADYVQAQRTRARAWREAEQLFNTVDFHLTPMSTIGAPRLDDILEGDQSRVFGSLHTPYWATVGCPTIALPIARAASGLPLSIQLAGPLFAEREVLAAAADFQKLTAFHLQRPEL